MPRPQKKNGQCMGRKGLVMPFILVDKCSLLGAGGRTNLSRLKRSTQGVMQGDAEERTVQRFAVINPGLLHCYAQPPPACYYQWDSVIHGSQQRMHAASIPVIQPSLARGCKQAEHVKLVARSPLRMAAVRDGSFSSFCDTAWGC